MLLGPGARLGPYAIESALGAGGMGEVYRARDTRLDRTVAVKVLGDGVAHDPHFRERFEREARSISALNHPHICTLFDVGHQGDMPYLVMELLEGETLAARLTRGALPPSQALSIAIQVGGALTAAHRVGIIHRDLKPGNIMLTRMRADSAGSPHAKLLDFGLARSEARDSGSATTQVALTAPGETLGTIPYMSPEQLEGRPLDARSDIWSFGCVLYEMFAGRRAFAGTSDARLISEILTSEPAPLAPASLDRVVRKCLAKDPDHRWQTSADLTDELQWIGRQPVTGDAPSTPVAAVAAPRRSRFAALLAGGLVLASLGAATGYGLRPMPRVLDPSFDVQPPPGAVWGDNLALSPDGRRLALLAITKGTPQVWIRDLDSVDPRPLAGTEGAETALFWSPDGTKIGFFAHRKLKTIPADGGPVLELADAPTPGGGTWNREGVIVYSPDAGIASGATGLWRVPASGGAPASMTTPPVDEVHRAPMFLPDGRHLLYTSNERVFVISIDDPSRPVNVLSSAKAAAFVAPGYLLFVRKDALWAQRFDPDTLKLSGNPVMTVGAVDGVPTRLSLFAFSVTDTGILCYRSPPPAMRQFVWVDRNGRELKRLPLTGALQNPVLSPDEKSVAFAMERSGNRDIHVMDLDTGVTRPVTFSTDPEDFPIWSHNGQAIAYRRRGDAAGMFEVPADGRGAENPLLALDASTADLFPRSYTRDGRALVYVGFRRRPTGVPDGYISVLPLPGGSPRTWFDSQANELAPLLSPDNKWVAFGIHEGNRRELYVQRFADAGGKTQISEGLAEGAILWSHDGGQLFYTGTGGELWAVPMKDGARTGPRQLLFRMGAFQNKGLSVAKDGRFLVNQPASGLDEKPLTVVMDWLRLLKN